MIIQQRNADAEAAMYEVPGDEDYLHRARKDLIEMKRLALEGRAKTMQDAAHAEAAKLMAQADEMLA
jgi:hypothetical protein